MNPSDIPARLAYWQRRLRIQDWDIEARVERMSSIGPGVFGNCARNNESRHARIRLLDPDDVDTSAIPSSHDLEETMVHELLHVVFHCASEDTESRVAFEQAIDSTARALVGLERAK